MPGNSGGSNGAGSNGGFGGGTGDAWPGEVSGGYNPSNYRDKALDYYGSNGSNVQAHHLFPQSIERATGFFSRVGINIHAPQNIKLVDPLKHAQTAYKYNSLWKDFIYNNPNANSSIIHHVVAFLMDLIGL